MIIDETYFTKQPNYIPNVVDVSIRGAGEKPSKLPLRDFIDNNERELLIRCFGVSIYNSIINALSLLPFAEDTEPPTLATAEQKWIDLINGKDYTKDGNLFL